MIDEKCVYQMIRNDSKVTREKLTNAIGKSIRTVQRITDKLATDGYITRIGKRKSPSNTEIILP